MLNKSKVRHIGLAAVVFLVFIFIAFFFAPSWLRSNYSAPVATVDQARSIEELGFKVVHVSTPDAVKAIYMTACVASTSGWRQDLKELIETTELNSVVIDIKDATGSVSYNSTVYEGKKGGCVVPDLQEFIGTLHDVGIYVIGRISVFQDPSYTTIHPELAVKNSAGEVWKDYKGLSFIDVGARPYWDYIISLAKESYELGFDEINFDYIRYPSDGNMKDTRYSWTDTTTIGSSTALLSKSEMLEKFFSYLYDHMKNSGAVTSADLFGMTTTVESDMNIGQVLEKALPYFDYIAPMVYPSHYPKNWNGFTNPASYPYEVIKIAMTRGLERERLWQEKEGIATSTPSKLRPWLQDFDLGATYNATEVRAQMRATYDTGLSSWMLWSAANKYTNSALLPE